MAPVVQSLVDQADAAFVPGPGQRLVERRPLVVTGLFGTMSLQRDYYFDGQRGHCPSDAALALETAYTPALARMLCRAASKDSYREASQDLFEYARIRVSDRQIQRLVGCVFLQTEVDCHGHPVRQENSTSYVGTFERAEPFGQLLRQDARRRGLTQHTRLIFIGDGAAWVWELARINFPGAVLILDFYHALQHVHQLAEALGGKDTPQSKRRISVWKKWLLRDKAPDILAQARTELAQGLDTETARKAIGYIENNLERMRYGTFRKAGYFIGSGVVEAGCKTVVGKRMKCSGMFWSQEGGQGVLDLRCASLSNRLDPFFQARAEQHRSRNDSVELTA